MRKWITLPVVVLVWLAFAGHALAEELTFDVAEDDAGVTIKVRGFDGEAADPKRVVTSRAGMLFFFDGFRAKTTRLRPQERHRLGYAQVGRSGKRVAVRLAQRERVRGPLSQNVTQTAVKGGLDIRIEDRSGPAEPAAAPEDSDAPDEASEAAPADTAVRSATLAALEASLGGADEAAEPSDDAEAAPAAVDPVQDDPPTEEAPADPPAGIGATAQAPQATSSPTTSAGLRSLLAVALLLGFGGAAIWWIKRRKPGGASVELDVVSRVGVGPKQSIVLVRAGGRQLLIGATERRIAVLTELGASPLTRVDTGATFEVSPPSPRTAAPAAAPDPSAPSKVAAFKERLQQALGKELTGELPLYNPEPEETPAHLRLLSSDPRWAGNEDAA